LSGLLGDCVVVLQEAVADTEEEHLARRAASGSRCFAAGAGHMDRSTKRRSSPLGPPSFLIFTLPRFLPFHAAESLLGLCWSNIFWVGLWDLVSSTVFPNDSPVAMSTLFILGTAGLFFTNALYEQSPDDGDPCAQSEPRDTASSVAQVTPPGVLADDKPAARRAAELAAEALEQRHSAADTPFKPPRWEPRRLSERILSNVCSVFCWVGVWDQVRVCSMSCFWLTLTTD